VEELIADYLAVGIDPTRSTIFAHSEVPALNQLVLPFLSLVTPPNCFATRQLRRRTQPQGCAH
jgi:tryptophanyl-tRNA synthetase